MREIIKKHSVKILIVLIVVTVIVLYIRKQKKEAEFQELMTAINDASTATGTFEDLNSNNAFDETLWKNPKFNFPKTHNMGGKERAIAQAIYDAKSVRLLSDDEDKAMAEFAKLRSKSEVSYIAWVFNNMFKRRLVDYIQFIDKGNNREELLNKINALPLN